MTTAVESPTPAAAETVLPVKSARIVSVDALRGFDMFWIIGAGSLVQALKQMHQNDVTRTLATQLTHVPWEGRRHVEGSIAAATESEVTLALDEGGSWTVPLTGVRVARLVVDPWNGRRTVAGPNHHHRRGKQKKRRHH